MLKGQHFVLKSKKVLENNFNSWFKEKDKFKSNSIKQSNINVF